jgi:pimeloyl-ACP methyl ester carboxylesterase
VPPRPSVAALPLPWVDRRTLVAADAVRIVAAHAPAAGDDRLVGAVVAHGFTGSLGDASYRRAAGWLAGAGVGVVGLDFRGHGGSAGRSTVGDREVLDLDAALDWLRVLGYRHLASVGFSMGGSVVLRHAALLGGVDAVVSVSSPGRWYYRGTPAMRRAHLAIEHPVGRLVSRVARGTRIASHGWDPLPLDPHGAAAAIDVPLLVVHGDADHYFPLDHAEDLAAAGSATLWVEPGFGHAENAATPELVGRIGAWVLEQVEERA